MALGGDSVYCVCFGGAGGCCCFICNDGTILECTYKCDGSGRVRRNLSQLQMKKRLQMKRLQMKSPPLEQVSSFCNCIYVITGFKRASSERQILEMSN